MWVCVCHIMNAVCLPEKGGNSGEGRPSGRYIDMSTQKERTLGGRNRSATGKAHRIEHRAPQPTTTQHAPICDSSYLRRDQRPARTTCPLDDRFRGRLIAYSRRKVHSSDCGEQRRQGCCRRCFRLLLPPLQSLQQLCSLVGRFDSGGLGGQQPRFQLGELREDLQTPFKLRTEATRQRRRDPATRAEPCGCDTTAHC